MTFKEFKDKYEHKKVEEYPSQIEDRPLVSVCVPTYQHEDYIKDCLDSILMQQTNFPYEIVLGEDESADETRKICIEYAKKYPQRIKLLLHHRENNIRYHGSPTVMFNITYCYYTTNGKYIAICAGDDYWTDPLKLQKQVEFMEENEECSACFHPVRNVYVNRDKDDLIAGPKVNGNYIFPPEEIIKGVYIRVISMIFRSDIVRNLPKWFSSMPFGDLPLQLICATKGNIGYIGGPPMAVYRRGIPGAWSELQDSNDKHKKKIWYQKRFSDHMMIFDMFNKYTNFKYCNEIEVRKKKSKIIYLLQCQNFCNKTRSWKLIRENFFTLLDFKNKKVLKIWVRFLLGKRFYHLLKKTIKQYI
jgi:glycosyltransferase involved in cell wall biosynthesis